MWSCRGATMTVTLLAAGPSALDISDDGQGAVPIFPLTKPEHWREVGFMRQRRYRENNLERVRPLSAGGEMAGGYFTAAAGGTIYSGDTYPEKYRETCSRKRERQSGSSRHPPAGWSEFCRPAPQGRTGAGVPRIHGFVVRPGNFATGPDGNLYVVDMYRETIETPESIPEELKKDLDFYSGDTMGRIYRIVPKDPAKSKPVRPYLERR